MKTVLFDMTEQAMDQSLTQAGKMIRDGENIVFPTETVYGLGANAFDPAAVKKIFEAKGRPGDNPLIVHIARPEEIKQLVKRIPEKAEKLISAYWPGPMTLIMEKQECVPDVVTAGLPTVAVRLPASATARKLIEAAGVPIAAPSANISGRPSPTKGQHVIEDMFGKVAGIIIREDIVVGLESTVIDMTTEPPTLLRPGGITVNDLEKVIGPIDVSPNITQNIIPEKVKSPGMKYTHYSPRGTVVIAKGSDQEKAEKILSQIHELKAAGAAGIGVLATDETLKHYQAETEIALLSLGSQKDPGEMSKNLFDRLRMFDELNINYIFAEDIDKNDQTLALLNRLYKSAGYGFI